MEKRIRRISFVLCQLLVVGTAVGVAAERAYGQLGMTAATAGALFLPAAAERIFRCRLHPVMYGASLFYLVGPMVGKCMGLYYTTAWWDKLLHLLGGILFAILGLYLFQRLNKGTKARLLCGTFALFLSVTVAAVWEIGEFAMDRLTGSDMQRDTWITSIDSCDLGSDGQRGSIQQIQQVVIDGVPLPAQGYLDIGLIDTMMDIIFETAGAAAVTAGFWVTRGRYAPIRTVSTEKNGKMENE